MNPHELAITSMHQVVEAAGIGHPGQSLRLQAQSRSQACRMRHEFPAHPASRGFILRQSLTINKKAIPKNGWHFY